VLLQAGRRTALANVKVTHGLDAVSVSLAACPSLPVFWWRRAPLAVFTFTTAAGPDETPGCATGCKR
jgi:hypothetical protein